MNFSIQQKYCFLLLWQNLFEVLLLVLVPEDPELPKKLISKSREEVQLFIISFNYLGMIYSFSGCFGKSGAVKTAFYVSREHVGRKHFLSKFSQLPRPPE